DGRREGIVTPHRFHSRLPSSLGDNSMVMWTTDRLFRLRDAIGGGLSSMGFEPGEVDGMPLAEFFEDGRPDSQLVAAHRSALAGETGSCSFRPERLRFA